MSRILKALGTYGRRLRSRNKPQHRARLTGVERLERRDLFAVAPILPLRDLSTVLIPSGTTPVHFFWDHSDTETQNELGYFFVDGPDGRITRRVDNDPDGAPLLDASGQPRYVRPGDVNYATVALAENNSVVAFAAGEVPNKGSADKIEDVLGDHYIAFYLIRGATTQAWRDAPVSGRPNVWFSVGDANSDRYEHFQATNLRDRFYRPNITQYKVEDSNIGLARRRVSPNDTDFNDLVFSVNIVPFATEDDYSIFNSGNNLDGVPQPLKIDMPWDFKNYGLGMLWNDYSPSHPRQRPRVTEISIDGGDTWLPLNSSRKQITVNDPSLHGRLTVTSNGGIDFVPDVNDTWWASTPINSDPDPDAIEVGYRISDGIDVAESLLTFTHGFYQRGTTVDNRHTGKKMYLLAGGGSSSPFDEGRQKFFQEGGNGGDILLIAQGTEQREFVNDVFEYYADGRSRSVTSLNITTREQANDPRLVKYVDGADVIWLGGGAQSFYQTPWFGTLLFSALVRASASNVAIGGTSAGMAILGQAAYVDLPWDSLKSRYATLQPLDPRVNLLTQTALPFGPLSNTSSAPLNNLITDTHFSSRDRMGRLIVFTARTNLNGLGVDESTAVLIQSIGGNWNWTVYGEGHAYIVQPSNRRPRLEDGLRLSFGPINVYRLDVGSKNLNDILAGAVSYHVTVSKGTVFTTENDGSLY